MDPNRPYPTRRQTRWSWLAVVLMLLAASASLLPLFRGAMGAAQAMLTGLLGLPFMAGATMRSKRACPVSPGERRTGSLGR